LEAGTEEVRQRQRPQASIADGYVKNWSHYAALERQSHDLPLTIMGRYLALPEESVSYCIAIKFWLPRNHQEVRNSFSMGKRRTAQLPGVAGMVSWMAPPPNGQVLALGVCTDGSEHNTIRLIDTDTGELLQGAPTQLLMDSGRAAWPG